jgi:nucleoside-diphosphate-sugar epimerase
MATTNLLARDLDEVLASTAEVFEELRGRQIFITGATGFFGCWLVETFVWANAHLQLSAKATILTRSPERFRQKVPHLADAGINIVQGDVRNFTFPEGEFSHIIHAATESSVDLNTQHPQVMFDTTVEGTRHCLDFAEHCGAGKFLLTSSGAVYGKQPAQISHLSEDFGGGPDPADPNSAYGEGKRAAELLCVLAAKKAGLQAKVARCFAFVGPYMKLDAHFAIGNFIRDYLAGQTIRVNGDGTPLRSYMYASDLMIWLWTILCRGESCRAYNVGSEDAVSIGDLAHQVSRTFSENLLVDVREKPKPGTTVAQYVPSTQRAQRELHLRCAVPLRSAIERTVAWNRSRETNAVMAVGETK